MSATFVRQGIKVELPVLSCINSVFICRENLVNIEINYGDLNYKITQQQKAVSVSELLGKGYLDLPQCSSIFCFPFIFTA